MWWRAWGEADGRTPETADASSRVPPLMIDTDMGRPVLYLINTETDALITVDLTLDAGFPGGLPLHTLLTPDGTHAYVTMMGSEQHPFRILVLRITSLDWPAGTAQMTITNGLQLEEAERLPRC